MQEAPFTLDAQAERYLTESLRGFAHSNLGLAICLVTHEPGSIHDGHSIDLCGFGADQLSDCERHTILGHLLWIRVAELNLMAGRELTVIEAGVPEKRPRLVIRGISEPEVRAALLGGK